MDKKTEKLLKKVGYFKIKAKYGDVDISHPFPNLQIGNHRKKYPSSQGISKTPGKKQLPVDAKQFPIGYTHKSGLQLVTQFDDLKYMSGKKF